MRGPDATRRVLASLSPPLAGVGLAVVTLLAIPGKQPDRHPAVAAARLEGTRAEDCVPCHAREVAEWQGSAMAYAARSPLVGALESLVEEQVGRSETCPGGAGVLRSRGVDACVDDRTGVTVTGAGGEGWCVNCHVPGENLQPAIPRWSARGDARSREPLRDLAAASSMEGISCAACHSTIGPVASHASRGARGYEGNPTWTSFATGASFLARPEDARGVSGIANSGYRLDPQQLLGGALDGARVHPAPTRASERYLASSEFCGACHDVRLFGTDTRGSLRGEHFKRLRNAYSEWRTWADAEARGGRIAPGCQDCHMSLYPGTCAPGSGSEGGQGCPAGTHFVAKAPGEYASALVSPSSPAPERVRSHWFTSVDLPLSPELPDALIEDTTPDASGVPVGLRARRDLLLRHTFRFEIGAGRRRGASLEVPIVIENVGAGHRVPAGFSQEREIWVELRVLDGRSSVVYEVGRLSRPDADLGDKRLLRITTGDVQLDARGRPQGMFGADVIDGPDVPAWSPDPKLGGTRFAGRGLVNLQNGFQRCVKCIGIVDASGRCQPGFEQGRTRADRFADGDYDLDTGECRSNLSGEDALLETYLPVGSLDADRGVAKAPDAILDTRSAPPGVPLTFTYLLDAGSRPGPFSVRARLLFRPFPPYLVRAFAAYERSQARAGLRPSGPQVDEQMLQRDEPLEIGRAEASVP